MRPDGVLCDAAAVARDDDLARLLAARGGLPVAAACGHIVQHCPPRRAPNALCVPIDVNVLEGHAGGLLAAPGPRGSRARRALPFIFGSADDGAEVLAWHLAQRLPYWHAEAGGGPQSGALPPRPPFADGSLRRALVMPALVIVAAAEVRAEEELFFDYALAPKGAPPAWFSSLPVALRWRTYDTVAKHVASRRRR